MTDWETFLNDVQCHLDALSNSGCDMPFFRGHFESKWPLLCGLGRLQRPNFDIESVLYYDFISLGGSLLGRHADSWDALFAMQHHGLPTRLLDWTTTFSAALYFAIRSYIPTRNSPEPDIFVASPCVWILDPFELNRLSQHDPAVANPYTDLDGSYQENFIDKSKSLGAKVLAIGPPQHAPRQSAQRSVFTLHDEVFMPIEKFADKCVRKFEVPQSALEDAVRFLKLAGVNEFSVFPDLDGLSRHLKEEHVSQC